jgi:hypothetical protein
MKKKNFVNMDQSRIKTKQRTETRYFFKFENLEISELDHFIEKQPSFPSF